ncbi:MmgE/PrpD family protein [Bradyrhizobium sp. 147]|uniref:MmgE/PrpD family protein n=1 Tax=Bradyrhizobium sp. 147 TaxID=2782623 RepID=UPI001FFBBA89|nr:MmgE/PrpD family protein [Bradyrhizobium sp. 147]MCK1680057.1 MmgE/PrpD family protein [Bradyrhizobium sp. 147]
MRPGKSDRTTSFAEALQTIATTELAPDAIRAAKERLLDMLGVTLDGLDQPSSVVAFRSVGPCAGPCTVIGRNTTAAAADAAFVNAVTSHTTGQEDCGGGVHPGTFVVPVSLALGEQYGRSGKDVLSAIVVGYEAAQRMHTAAAAALYSNKFRAVPTIGLFGAAASASILSGLNTEQLANALNFAANMAGGLLESFADGTMELHVQAGLAARGGITAAALARGGGKTTPRTLDGPYGFFSTFGHGRSCDPDALTIKTRELGILSAWSKPFPACKGNLDTMLIIRSLQPVGFAPSEIERVVLSRRHNDYDAPGMLADPPYSNMVQAMISAKFTSVAALLGKPITDWRYFKESCRDPDVEEVAAKTSLLVAENDVEEVTVEVVLKGGATVTMRSSDMADVSWETDVRAKFERLAAPRLHGATRNVLDLVANLESAPDIGRLMKLVRA